MLRLATSQRHRRGIALVATVLISIVAAAIVLVITTQSIQASRSASNQSDSTVASQAAADTQRSISTWLSADPYAFLSSVSPLEDARVCANGSVVQPGGTWTLGTCGTSWTYETPANITVNGTQNSSTSLNALDGAIVRVQITPPSSATSLLGVNVTALYGVYSAGLSLSYKMTGSEGYTVFSSSDLHLDNLASGCTSACSSLSGSLYTDGTMYLATSGHVTTATNTQLESETGFSPTPPSSSNALFYSPSPSAATTSDAPISDIRSVTPTQLTLAALRAGVTRNTAIACPGSNPTSYPSDGALTSLCLNPGTTIPALYDGATHASGNVTVPSGAAAYLFVFDDASQADASPNTVAIYDVTSSPAPAGNCVGSCDLLSVSASQVAAQQSPGQYSYWSSGLLGVFTIPRSGLIFSPVDSYLSLCDNASSDPTGASPAWATFNGSCPTLSAGSSTPGMVVGQSATLIAGTATTPANVYVSGSVTSASGVSFGAIATGSVVVPYWSRPPGTTSSTMLTLQGAYTALGYDSITSAISTFPATLDSTIADNVASSMALSGSLAGSSVSLNLGLFSQVSLQGSPQLASSPPPYYGDFSGAWSLVSQTVVPASVNTSG